MFPPWSTVPAVGPGKRVAVNSLAPAGDAGPSHAVALGAAACARGDAAQGHVLVPGARPRGLWADPGCDARVHSLCLQFTGTAHLSHQPARGVAFVGRGRFFAMTLSERPLMRFLFHFWYLLTLLGKESF